MASTRRVLAVIWTVIPPLLFSALIHSVDPDVGGVGGLTRPSTMLSVAVYSLPIVASALVCLAVAVRWGRWASAALGVLLSAPVAVALALLQTPHPPGLMANLRPVVGGTVLLWLFLAAAVAPAFVLGWPRRGRTEGSAP